MSNPRKKTAEQPVVSEQTWTGDALKHELDTLARVLNEGLPVLRKAAVKQRTWQQALQNPRKYLLTKGVEIPDGVEVVLLQAANPITAAHIIDAAQRPSVYFPPDFCPTGLVPIWHRKLERICTKSVEVERCYTDPATGQTTCFRHTECLEYDWQFVDRWFCGLKTI